MIIVMDVVDAGGCLWHLLFGCNDISHVIFCQSHSHCRPSTDAGGFGGVEWSQGPLLRLSEWETLRSALPEASGIFSAGETLEASSGSDVLLLCIGLNILQTAPKVILRLRYDD